MKKVSSVIILLLLCFPAPSLHATGMPVIDSTSIAQQVLGYVQQIKQLTEAVTQTRQQLMQYQTMMQNLQSMNPAQQAQVIAGVGNSITHMQTIQQKTQGITYDYTKLMTQYDKLYPRFADSNGGLSSADYATKMRAMNDQTHNAMADSMKAQGLADPDKIKGEQDSLKTLLQASQDSDGALKAAQTANQIAALQAQQLMDQKIIMSTAYRAQTSYYEQEIKQQEMSAARGKYLMQDFGKSAPRTPSNILNIGK